MVDNQFKAQKTRKGKHMTECGFSEGQAGNNSSQLAIREKRCGKEKGGDHSSTIALVWWHKHEGAPLEISGWAMRRLCRQASSTTSGHAFLEAGLIVSKKR